jgi:hypothetical protein
MTIPHRIAQRTAQLGLAALLALAGAQAAQAQASNAPPPPPGGGRMPPQAAIDACKGKTEGATVSFTGRQGNTLSGQCRSFNGQLVAAPERGPGERRGPPAEAVAACKGKAAGAAVSFQDREGSTRNGTCTDVNGTLAAVPPDVAQRRGQGKP